MDILRLGGLFVVLVPWYGRERPSARGDGVRPQQIVVYPKCLPSRLPGAVAFHRDKEPTAKQASMRSANGGPPSAYLPCKPIARRISTLALWVHGEPSLALHWPFTGPSLAWRTQAIALQSPSASVAPNPSCPRPCSCPNTTTWLHHHREVFLEHRHAKLRVPLHQRIDQRFSRPCPPDLQSSQSSQPA
jgi:hypothetical protein